MKIKGRFCVTRTDLKSPVTGSTVTFPAMLFLSLDCSASQRSLLTQVLNTACSNIGVDVDEHSFKCSERPAILGKEVMRAVVSVAD